MKHQSLLLVTLLAAILVSSCASKKQFQALQAENAKLKQLNEDTRVELAECNATTKNLQDRIAAEQQRLKDEKKRVDDLRSDYQKLQGSLDQSLRQNSQGNIKSMPPTASSSNW